MTLAAGGPVPGSFAEDVVLARMRAEFAPDVDAAHDRLVDWAAPGWTSAVHEHRDAVLAGPLRAQLDGILAAARDTGPDGDRAHLSRLAHRYEELRELQEDILGTAFALGDRYRVGGLRLDARVHEFADLDALWPDWGFLALVDETTHAPAPWPRRTAHVERLLYAAHHGAWMPTVTETAVAWERAKVAWQARQDAADAERERVAAANVRANRVAAGLSAEIEPPRPRVPVTLAEYLQTTAPAPQQR